MTPRATINDLPNEYISGKPKKCLEIPKTTVNAQGGAIYSKKAGKRLSPTPKQVQTGLVTKDSPRIAQ